MMRRVSSVSSAPLICSMYTTNIGFFNLIGSTATQPCAKRRKRLDITAGIVDKEAVEAGNSPDHFSVADGISFTTIFDSYSHNGPCVTARRGTMQQLHFYSTEEDIAKNNFNPAEEKVEKEPAEVKNKSWRRKDTLSFPMKRRLFEKAVVEGCSLEARRKTEEGTAEEAEEVARSHQLDYLEKVILPLQLLQRRLQQNRKEKRKHSLDDDDDDDDDVERRVLARAEEKDPKRKENFMNRQEEEEAIFTKAMQLFIQFREEHPDTYPCYQDNPIDGEEEGMLHQYWLPIAKEIFIARQRKEGRQVGSTHQAANVETPSSSSSWCSQPDLLWNDGGEKLSHMLLLCTLKHEHDQNYRNASRRNNASAFAAVEEKNNNAGSSECWAFVRQCTMQELRSFLHSIIVDRNKERNAKKENNQNLPGQCQNQPPTLLDRAMFNGIFAFLSCELQQILQNVKKEAREENLPEEPLFLLFEDIMKLTVKCFLSEKTTMSSRRSSELLQPSTSTTFQSTTGKKYSTAMKLKLLRIALAWLYYAALTNTRRDQMRDDEEELYTLVLQLWETIHSASPFFVSNSGGEEAAASERASSFSPLKKQRQSHHDHNFEELIHWLGISWQLYSLLQTTTTLLEEWEDEGESSDNFLIAGPSSPSYDGQHDEHQSKVKEGKALEQPGKKPLCCVQQLSSFVKYWILSAVATNPKEAPEDLKTALLDNEEIKDCAAVAPIITLFELYIAAKLSDDTKGSDGSMMPVIPISPFEISSSSEFLLNSTKTNIRRREKKNKMVGALPVFPPSLLSDVLNFMDVLVNTASSLRARVMQRNEEIKKGAKDPVGPLVSQFLHLLLPGAIHMSTCYLCQLVLILSRYHSEEFTLGQSKGEKPQEEGDLSITMQNPLATASTHSFTLHSLYLSLTHEIIRRLEKSFTADKKEKEESSSQIFPLSSSAQSKISQNNKMKNQQEIGGKSSSEGSFTTVSPLLAAAASSSRHSSESTKKGGDQKNKNDQHSFDVVSGDVLLVKSEQKLKKLIQEFDVILPHQQCHLSDISSFATSLALVRWVNDEVWQAIVSATLQFFRQQQQQKISEKANASSNLVLVLSSENEDSLRSICFALHEVHRFVSQQDVFSNNNGGNPMEVLSHHPVSRLYHLLMHHCVEVHGVFQPRRPTNMPTE